ncbi:MAG: type I restriction enzyme endonuclease domain-containing protein, partial [Solirubrobacteraceae bacterium]
LVGVARNLAERIRSLDEPPDVERVAGAVSELLDRSVGAEEYVIRAAADGAQPVDDGLIDLNTIEFDALAARLAGRKRSATQRLAWQLGEQLEASARRNPTRLDLVAKLRDLIEIYNAGSLNVDEMLRRLQALSRDLSEDEARTGRAGLSEAELAIFDLLTKPDPVLTDEERKQVKQVAHTLMQRITDRLVLDWRRKAETREAARVLVRDVLDDLPEAYDAETWQRKTDAVFNHIFAS